MSDLGPTHRYCGRPGCLRCAHAREMARVYRASPALMELLAGSSAVQRERLTIICDEEEPDVQVVGR